MLDYAAPALRGATYGDLINDNQISAALNFSIEWSDAKYQFSIRNVDEMTEIISEFKYTSAAGVLNGQLYLGEKDKFDENRDYSLFDVKKQDGTESDRWTIEGMRPIAAISASGREAATEIEQSLDALGSSVHWLAAIRSSVPRFFELLLGSSGEISSDGSGVAESLCISHMKDDGISRAVSSWLARTCNCTLSYSASSGAAIFNRQIFPFNVTLSSGAQIAVKDIGEGVAQALPVVTLCHQARLGKLGAHPILAFEQPELHLHPSATVELANEIITCVVDGSLASHVIETHAESMLIAVQIAIVEKRIKPSDVIVYWVHSDDAGTRLRSISFDEEGFPKGGWPQGVFRETLDQSRRLSELRIESGAN